jgi:hypothetical protein
VGPCKGCQFLIKAERKSLCVREACFNAKIEAMARRYLAQASLLTGIPVFEGNTEAGTTNFHYGAQAQTLALARSIRCPNLRLAYDGYADSRGYHDDHLFEIGFGKAKILCGKQEQWCSCITAVKAGLQGKLLDKVAPVENVAVGNDGPHETEYKPAITVDELKDVAREARQQKKADAQEAEAMRAEAAKQIATYLLDVNTNPRLLLAIIEIAGGPVWQYERESKGDYSENPQAWCEEFRLGIGKVMVSKKVYDYGAEPDPEKTLKQLNLFLKSAGVAELVYGVSAETVKGE